MQSGKWILILLKVYDLLKISKNLDKERPGKTRLDKERRRADKKVSLGFEKYCTALQQNGVIKLKSNDTDMKNGNCKNKIKAIDIGRLSPKGHIRHV